MIRAYQDSDFEMICRWWASRGEIGPMPGMLIENGTFVLELSDKAVMSLTCYITLSSIAYIEGFIADPELPKEIRRELGHKLWDHCIKYAEENKAKHLLTYSGKDGLTKRYEQFGFTKSISNLTVLYRTLGV